MTPTINSLLAGWLMAAHPVPLPPGMSVTTPPYTRPAYATGLSQDQWKQKIVNEAQRFCNAYPGDPICHFK